VPNEVNVDQMSQAFKERYPTTEAFIKASQVIKQLQADFPFDNGGIPGKAWNEAILMTEEQGVVYSTAGTDATLPTPIPMKMERARFVGNKIEMVSAVSLEAALRGDTNDQSMARTVFTAQGSMRDTHVMRKEWNLLNGGRSVAEIDTGGIAAGATSAQKKLTFTVESWVPTLWTRAVNATFDIYDEDSEARDANSVKRNDSSASAVYTCVSVDFDTRTVTFNAPASSDWDDVVAGDRLWWSTSYLQESLGMTAIAADTSGSIFLTPPEGSSTVPVYGIWKGITKDLSGAPLTMNSITDFCAEVADRSSEDNILTLRVGPRQYHGLNIELTASRYYDGSYKKDITNGFESIRFYTPNGQIQIKSHRLMRWGEALLTDDTCFSRRGVTEMENTFPDGSGGFKLYRLRDTKNQLEFRTYSQDGMFCNKPYRAVIFKNASVPGRS
jgi:hypothetical protein